MVERVWRIEPVRLYLDLMPRKNCEVPSGSLRRFTTMAHVCGLSTPGSSTWREASDRAKAIGRNATGAAASHNDIVIPLVFHNRYARVIGRTAIILRSSRKQAITMLSLASCLEFQSRRHDVQTGMID